MMQFIFYRTTTRFETKKIILREILKRFELGDSILDPVSDRLYQEEKFIVFEQALKLTNIKADFEDNYPIITTSKEGNFFFIERLLQFKEVDPSARNNACIFFAVKNGFYITCRILLKDKRTDPTNLFICEYGNSLLCYAVKKQFFYIVSYLLENKKIRSYHVEEAFKCACGTDSSVKILELILEKRKTSSLEKQ